MNIVYKVHENYSEDGRGNNNTIIGYFINKDDAEKIAKGKGNYGQGNAKIEAIKLFESIRDFNENNDEAIRTRALNKLNDAEKQILGLSY